MSQNADTVKVGAVVSDTRPCLRPHRVTDPTLAQAVTRASLQSVALAPELPYRRLEGNRIFQGHAKNCTDHEDVRRQPVSAQQMSRRIPCEEDRDLPSTAAERNFEERPK